MNIKVVSEVKMNIKSVKDTSITIIKCKNGQSNI